MISNENEITINMMNEKENIITMNAHITPMRKKRRNRLGFGSFAEIHEVRIDTRNKNVTRIHIAKQKEEKSKRSNNKTHTMFEHRR